MCICALYILRKLIELFGENFRNKRIRFDREFGLFLVMIERERERGERKRGGRETWWCHMMRNIFFFSHAKPTNLFRFSIPFLFEFKTHNSIVSHFWKKICTACTPKCALCAINPYSSLRRQHHVIPNILHTKSKFMSRNRTILTSWSRSLAIQTIQNVFVSVRL